MKVTVKVNLNVRVGKPSLNAPCYQYLAPGSIIEVDGNLYPGDLYDGIDTWYKDEAGNYYWSGGVDNPEKMSDYKTDIKIPLWQFDKNKMSWVHDSVENGGLGIVDLWNLMGVRGEGVSVAVIDTGIIEHADFKRDGFSIVKGSHFRDGLSSIIDSDGHGTNSASIIGATGNIGLYGIAPEVDLYIIKTAENQYVNKERFLSGLRLIENEWPLDIISISYCFNSTDSVFENYFNSINENCIVLSALNHPNGNIISCNNSQFPAFYNNVVPISSIKKNLKEIQTPCELIDSLNKNNWGFPGENILALNEKGNCQNAQQTSIAAPLGSGIFALFISYMRKRNIEIGKISISKLMELFKNTSTLKEIQCDTKSCNILFINPIEAYKQFNNYFNKKI